MATKAKKIVTAKEWSYEKLRNRISDFIAKGRSESAAFLAWYLANYYRLEDFEAIDAVCDDSGDRGVDGIYINVGEGTIDVFQSKISQKAKSSIGDSTLREFAGTLTQFSSDRKLKELERNSADNMLGRLITSLNLVDLLQEMKVRGVFLSNVDLDANGKKFLSEREDIIFVGVNELTNGYISTERYHPISTPMKFDVEGFEVATFRADSSTLAVIAPIQAQELVKLPGIQDQSLFSRNVRGSLGKTQVNRDIQNSVKEKKLHKFFPLFHNGITITASSVVATSKEVTVKEYFVVNGCQSLNTLFHNQPDITSDLRLLVKFVQLKGNPTLGDTITAYSNNQNGVKARDFKSNDKIQVRLQNEMLKNFKGAYALEVKRGEQISSKGVVISNDLAGLQLIAFDLKEPWTTHRKYQIFDERYSEVFGRPEVNADRIVMCFIIVERVEKHLLDLKNELVAKYALTKYAVLFFVRRILENDDFGGRIIASPEQFVRKAANRRKFEKLVDGLLATLMIDFNAETEALPEDFDYRGKMRDKEFILKLANELVASYKKDLKRGKVDPLKSLWR